MVLQMTIWLCFSQRDPVRSVAQISCRTTIKPLMLPQSVFWTSYPSNLLQPSLFDHDCPACFTPKNYGLLQNLSGNTPAKASPVEELSSVTVLSIKRRLSSQTQLQPLLFQSRKVLNAIREYPSITVYQKREVPNPMDIRQSPMELECQTRLSSWKRDSAAT